MQECSLPNSNSNLQPMRNLSPLALVSEMKLEKAIAQGTIIHSEKPFVYCLSSKVRTDYCDFCFKKGKLLKCTACQYVYYCGKVCQTDAWPIHKAECKNLKKVAPRIIPDAARMMARLIRTLNKNGHQVRSYYTEMNFRMYKDLMSHYPDLKNDSRRMEHFQSICLVLNEFMSEDILPNPVDLMGMFGRMCINSFNICNEEQHTLGTGMYLGASVLDHSCEPNALAMFQGTTLQIRTLKPLRYLNWSEIYITYIDVLNTTKNRVEELEKMYYFTCNCQKCLSPDPAEMLAAACPNQNCDNPIHLNTTDLTECKKCGEKIPAELKDKFEEVTELTDIHLQTMKDLAYLDTCRICLKKQRGVLHKFNIKHVRTLDLAFESSIHFEKFEEAEELGQQLVDPFYRYYGKFHPLTGLLHLKLGKILMYLDKAVEGMKQLKTAYEVLKVTHGIQSEVFREELMPMIRPSSNGS